MWGSPVLPLHFLPLCQGQIDWSKKKKKINQQTKNSQAWPSFLSLHKHIFSCVCGSWSYCNLVPVDPDALLSRPHRIIPFQPWPVSLRWIIELICPIVVSAYISILLNFLNPRNIFATETLLLYTVSANNFKDGGVYIFGLSGGSTYPNVFLLSYEGCINLVPSVPRLPVHN